MDVSEKLDAMGNPMFVVKSEKFKTPFEVVKEFGGYAFYRIKQTKGQVPDKLSGRYTNHERALEALKLYCLQAPKSRTVRRDENTKAREKQKAEKNATKLQSDNKEQLQQGTAD